MDTDSMDANLVAVKADKAHAQRAIKWLRTQHNVLASYVDGSLNAPPGGNPDEVMQLLRDALKATIK